MAKVFGISGKEALEIYRATLKVYTLNGTIERDFQERIIAFQRKQLKVLKSVPPENVYDFSILRSLIKK